TPPPVWRLYGPSDVVGSEGVGRVDAIAVDPGNSDVIYVGAAGGGLWESPGGGGTRIPLTDKLLPTLSIAPLAPDPTDTKHIYVATGDGYGRDNPFWGGTYSTGVWATNDGGMTWQHLGPSPLTLGQKQTIRRLVMHPANPKVLLAATSAGLFRTDDAG